MAPLLKGDIVVESERALARGALAYVTNHEADAKSLLDNEDLNSLDVRLAGEVAFARSVLETKRDSKAAVELLDWARLLAPGGLVEEAALRREIALLAEARDVARAAMLTRQYSTRFAASLYAVDFFRDLAAAIAQFGLADDPANYRLLSRAVVPLAPEVRRDFLLGLAKSAIVEARFDAPRLRRPRRSRALARTARKPCAPASTLRPAECSLRHMTRPWPICRRSPPRSLICPTPVC